VLLFEHVPGARVNTDNYIFSLLMPRSRGPHPRTATWHYTNGEALHCKGWLRERGLTCGRSDCAVTEPSTGGTAWYVDGIIGIIRGSSFEVTHRVQPYYAPARAITRIYFLDALRSKDFEFFSFYLNDIWNDGTIYRYLVAPTAWLSRLYRSTLAIGSFDRSLTKAFFPFT